MESVIIETLANPPCRFRLESSRSHLSFDRSDSEETEIKHGDLIEEFKNLSFEEVLDSKYMTSKCSNKISAINSQLKDISGDLTLVENTKVENNRFSSSSKNKLKFVVEADVESTFCKDSTKNSEITSKKENNIGKLSFVENLENIENQLPSLSLTHKNKKSLNKYYKSSTGISAGDESDSDSDEQVESITLRGRDPTRHNRPENNKQQRQTPLSRNHTKPSRPHFNSNNNQTFGNLSPHIFYNFNTSHDYDYVSHLNNTDFEIYGSVSPSTTTFHSNFSTLESETCEEFEGLLSSIAADQIFSVIPCTAANPCTVTDQVVNGIPYTVDAALDSGIGNSNDIFFEEINDDPYFDNLKENLISGSAVSIVENEMFLDPCLENITEEELENIIRNLSDSKLDDLFRHNPVDLNEEQPKNLLSRKKIETVFDSSKLNQDICVASTVNYPNNNQQILFSEFDNRHSFFSKANVEKTSFPPNLCKENDIFEKTGQSYSSEYLVNKSNNNITSTNWESLSQNTTDYITTSNEIEHEIAKVKEMKETIKKGLENVSELSREIVWDDGSNKIKESYVKDDSERKNNNQTCKSLCKTEKTKVSTKYLVNKYSNNVTSTNWESLSLNTTDYITTSNEIEHEISKVKRKEKSVKNGLKNVSELSGEIDWNDELNKIKGSNKKDDSERKNLNQTCKSPCKTEKIKICWMLGTTARDKLFNSLSFCKRKWEHEKEQIEQQIKSGKLGTKENKVIHVLKKNRKTKYRGSNLHDAILSENIERIFCLVEWHKEYHDGISEINLRDTFNKTVLDYSKEKGLDLLTDYLRENTAKESISIK